MSIYPRLKKTATTLTRKYGIPAKVVTIDGAKVTDCYAVFVKSSSGILPVSPGGETVEVNKKVIINSVSKVPSVTDVLKIGPLSYRIMAVEESKPADVVTHYTLEVE